jgi:hypothetical protein
VDLLRGQACFASVKARGARCGHQAVRACADGPTRPGIDVSFYQGVIDWPRKNRTP